MAVVVHLIRHGETDDNRNHIIQGQRDTHLNPFGVQQAQSTAQYLCHHPPRSLKCDQVWSSDLSRAQKTADIIADALGNGSMQVRTDKRLRERFLGDLEGKQREKVCSVVGAESSEAVTSRLTDFWREEILTAPHEGEPGKTRWVVVVGHSAALRGLLEGSLIGKLGYHTDQTISMSKRLGNCSITEVEIDNSGSGRILSIGSDDHLTQVKSSINTNADEMV